MNNLFRLTSFRLIIIYTLLFALSIGFVAFYLYWSTSRDFQIKVDDEIIGKVKILKKTKTLVFLFCELKCNDKIITSASGVWKILAKR